MDIENLIEQLSARGLRNGSSLGYHSGLFDDAATALSALQAENEKLREKIEDAMLEGYAKGLGEMDAELEKVKQEKDAAADCIYKIEDDLDRGNDNDWAREHISEWESQKEG